MAVLVNVVWLMLLAGVGLGAADSPAPGGVPPAQARAMGFQSTGRLEPTQVLRLSLGLPFRDPEGVRRFLADTYRPGHPGFRAFLTPEEFTRKFGPTVHEYERVQSFATAQRLRVTSLHSNRMLVGVEGAVGDIERAFGVRLTAYTHPDRPGSFYANDSSPARLESAPRMHVGGLRHLMAPQSLGLARASVLPRGAGGSGPNGTLMGSDFRSAYLPDVTGKGTGQVLGLVELDGYYASDIVSYKAKAGLPDVALQNVLIDGFNGQPAGRRPGSGNEEVSLDIEVAISLAPGLSKVMVYEAAPTATLATVNHLLNRIATDNLARQISCSWGFDTDATTDQIFQQYAAQGQSFYLASGDSGAFHGVVTQPADNPYVTVVGGTTLTLEAGTAAWQDEVVWSGSGGGISTLFPIPDWQAGMNMELSQGSTAYRNMPDVAMIADNVFAIVNRGQSAAFTGTSIAAPLWAAFTAIVNEEASSQGLPPLGFGNPAFYAIGRDGDRTGAFHDIVSGENSDSGQTTGFPAVAGYDLCTGWGSPNGRAMVNALLHPPGPGLVIYPPLGFTAQRPAVGNWTVSSQIYRLTNTTAKPLNWAMTVPVDWLNGDPVSGQLEPGGSTNVVVQVSSIQTNLLLGELEARVGFTNLTDQVGETRPVRLLIGNGGFETGDLNQWTLSGTTAVNFVDSLDTAIFQGGTTIDGLDDSAFVHSGVYGLFLGQSKTVATLSRSLPTVPGARYRLSFWLSNPLEGTPSLFRVRWNGATLFEAADLDALVWTNFQFTVTAAAELTQLQFAARNDLNAFALDDIKVGLIPGPVIESVAMVAGQWILRCRTETGAAYQVESTDVLSPPDWKPVGTAITASGDRLELSDAAAMTSQRFYRVTQLP